MTEPAPSVRSPAEADGASADPRLELVYHEAINGLDQQRAALESLHNRAGTLIFAASFASSLLGSRALADGLNAWDWVAVGLLLGIGVLTVLVLWPYYNLSFRFDVQYLLDQYIDRDPPVTMPEMHRALSLRAKADWARNGRLVHRMREAFQLALILLLVEILAWLFSIAGQAG